MDQLGRGIPGETPIAHRQVLRRFQILAAPRRLHAKARWALATLDLLAHAGGPGTCWRFASAAEPEKTCGGFASKGLPKSSWRSRVSTRARDFRASPSLRAVSNARLNARVSSSIFRARAIADASSTERIIYHTPAPRRN